MVPVVWVCGSGAAKFENRAIFEVSCHVITNMPIFEFTWPISDFTWLKNHVISNIAYFRIYMALWGHVNSNIHGRNRKSAIFDISCDRLLGVI